MALFSLAGGVAAAVPGGQDDAVVSKTTDDGWNLGASLTGIVIDPVPISTSKEVFVSATARLIIAPTNQLACTAEDQSRCVKGGAIDLRYQFGCQVDTTEGGSLNAGTNSLINSGITPNVSSTATPGATTPAPVSVGANGIATSDFNEPYGVVNLKPGVVKDDSLNGREKVIPDKALEPNEGKPPQNFNLTASVQTYHLQVDGCAGAAFVRLYAIAKMNTGRSNDQISAYSETVSI